MKRKAKNTLLWTVAILITLAASVYQRVTGPTYPKEITTIVEGQEYTWKLPRSGGEKDCAVILNGLEKKSIEATVLWRHYPLIANEKYQAIKLQPISGQGLIGNLPKQREAGKLAYYLIIDGKSYFQQSPIIIRFKGDVPAGVLIPHITFLFGAMLLGSFAFFLALLNDKRYKKYALLTTISLIIGGFIFGPLVQKAAFGTYWTGFPYGFDLTDNKTLIALIAMLIALFTRRLRWNRGIVIAAILVLFGIFCVPHSLGGSELNRTTGQIESASENK